MDDKQFLYDKYITDPSQQRVISNDGAYIVFFELWNDIVVLHQSNELEDSFVCIDIKDLTKIVIDFDSENCK
jgi:hypothetical protein